jgi:hypothetical protein
MDEYASWFGWEPREEADSKFYLCSRILLGLPGGATALQFEKARPLLRALINGPISWQKPIYQVSSPGFLFDAIWKQVLN